MNTNGRNMIANVCAWLSDVRALGAEVRVFASARHEVCSLT
jgi:hypothetical protein